MSYEDDRINARKIAAYQKLVRALSYEKHVIARTGPFSVESAEADEATRKARRNYNLWAKK
jgi:hypothetical protein